MGIDELFSRMPFASLLGIEVTHADDGVAVAHLTLTDDLTSNPARGVAHGGAAFALADTVGGAAVVSLIRKPAPTVDMRIDYLEPGTDDMAARAEVVRSGNTSAVVDITVAQGEGIEGVDSEGAEEIARVRGVYKLGVEEGAAHDWSVDGGGSP